jgi:hypothetical protein
MLSSAWKQTPGSAKDSPPPRLRGCVTIEEQTSEVAIHQLDLAANFERASHMIGGFRTRALVCTTRESCRRLTGKLREMAAAVFQRAVKSPKESAI